MTSTELQMVRPLHNAHDLPIRQSHATGVQVPRAPVSCRGHMVTIRSGGIDFLARERMAAVFLGWALDLMAKGESGQVPLLHSRGLDLLLITPTTAVACNYDGRALTDIQNHWDAQVRRILDVETQVQ